MNWSDMTTAQRIEAIRRVYVSGMSVRHIASHIAGSNRNQIIGYFHRYSQLAKDCPLAKPAHTGSVKPRPRAGKPIMVKTSKPLPVAIMDPVEPTPLNLTIDQFTHRSCKWPVSGPDHMGLTYFCGQPRDFDRSYCEYHQRRSVSRGTESERSAHRILKNLE